jgi:hypothetical protein
VETGGIETVRFPIRLGDRRKWKNLWMGDDGLVGFYRDGDYTRFIPAFGLTDEPVTHNAEVSIAEPLQVTLLMNPSQGVCATAGILPRTMFQLPYGDIGETLESKQVVFFTGPLLSPASSVRMPQPSDLYGEWSWTHHPNVTDWAQAPITDVHKEDPRLVDDTLQISEGWLKLITSPLAIRAFTVKGRNTVEGTDARFTASPGERLVLSWAANGADEIELRKGTDTLFVSGRHPLPMQYAITVDGAATFTLIARSRAERLTPQRTETKSLEIAIEGTKASRPPG